MRLYALTSSAALIALCGCDQVLGIETGTESPWFCNANVAAPSGQNSYDFHFIDDMLNPVTPSTVLLCAKSDPTCASSTSLTVTNGTLRRTLDASDDGYLDVPRQPDWSAIVELGPAGNVVPTERTFPLFSALDVNYLRTTAGLMQDGSNGALLVAPYDCNEMPAEDVTIAVTSEGRPVGSSPLYFGADLKPLMTSVSTTSTWLEMVPDIPPSDTVTVTLTRASDQVVVATAPVHVRATTFTILYLGPTKTQ